MACAVTLGMPGTEKTGRKRRSVLSRELAGARCGGEPAVLPLPTALRPDCSSSFSHGASLPSLPHVPPALLISAVLESGQALHSGGHSVSPLGFILRWLLLSTWHTVGCSVNIRPLNVSWRRASSSKARCSAVRLASSQAACLSVCVYFPATSSSASVVCWVCGLWQLP